MVIAPAALITALVLVLGFVMVGPDGQTDEGRPSPTTSTTTSPAPEPTQPSSTPTEATGNSKNSPGSKGKDNGPSRPHGKLTAPQVTLKRKPRVKVTPATSIRIASFNLLGHSHTEKGGHKAKLASGPVRMGQQLGILDSYRVEVAGLQELQPPQMAVLNNHSGTWGVYPGNLDRMSMPNSIVWRKSVFDAVRTETVSIPYFFGQPREMPYVLLEHKETKQRFWIANFHNPANAHGDASRWRAAALAREVQLANDLAADGYPIFFTGDMNDRAGYFCGLTGQTKMKAANGGSTGGTCAPPTRMDVDWIFGSDEVLFSEFVSERTPAIARTTDHPIVVATATLPEKRERIKRKQQRD